MFKLNSMQFESTSKSAGKAINKVNFSRTNRSRDVASSIVIGEDTASVAKAIQLKEMERTVAASGSGQTTIDKSIIKQQVLIVKEQCKGGGDEKS